MLCYRAMTQKQELRLRYEAAKKDLEHRIAEAKADASSQKNDQAENLQDRLKQLESAAKENWNDMSESAAKKVNDLLDRFEGKKAS